MTNSLLDTYKPPFTLTTDIIITITFLPLKPLRQSFPAIKFFSCFGRVPTFVGLARYTKIISQAGSLEGTADKPIYNEIFFMSWIKGKSLFCPGIFATSDLSVAIAKEYGMPKRLFSMNFRKTKKEIQVQAQDKKAITNLHFSLITTMHFWKIKRWFTGRQSPRVFFPSKHVIRGSIKQIGRVRLCRSSQGSISLNEKWLIKPVKLFPLGFYITPFIFILPQPE